MKTSSTTIRLAALNRTLEPVITFARPQDQDDGMTIGGYAKAGAGVAAGGGLAYGGYRGYQALRDRQGGLAATRGAGEAMPTMVDAAKSYGTDAWDAARAGTQKLGNTVLAQGKRAGAYAGNVGNILKTTPSVYRAVRQNSTGVIDALGKTLKPVASAVGRLRYSALHQRLIHLRANLEDVIEFRDGDSKTKRTAIAAGGALGGAGAVFAHHEILKRGGYQVVGTQVHNKAGEVVGEVKKHGIELYEKGKAAGTKAYGHVEGAVKSAASSSMRAKTAAIDKLKKMEATLRETAGKLRK